MEKSLEDLIRGSSSFKAKDGSYNMLRDSFNTDDEMDRDPFVDTSIPPIPDDEVPTIDELLEFAVRDKASDVHLVVGAPPKYRVDGELIPIPGYGRLLVRHTRQILAPLFKTKEVEEFFENDGDFDFAYSKSGLGRFRVNYYKQRNSWSAVFRQLSSKIPKPQDLGLPEAVINLASLKRGIVLVTGPTGSGKSTTLASIIGLINEKYHKNIITLEDPIEYIHTHKTSNVSQREMGVDSKNFASALRASLREDPDVILVGEMRDFETISTAITAAETGHLVFSTLHTIGAAPTIDRIIDTYPAVQQAQCRAQLANCMQGVISQQLMPRIGGGRIAALEIMLANSAVRAQIREGKIAQIAGTIQTNKGQGMQLMDDHILQLFRIGKISAESAIEFAVDKKKMASDVSVGSFGGFSSFDNF